MSPAGVDQGKELRVVIVLEGRDGAGKGGTIKALTERVSPRVFRTVALPAPSDRQKSQIYFQRYMEHFPAAGEIVIFDRAGTTAPASSTSWGSATDKQYKRFLDLCPVVERFMVEGGTIADQAVARGEQRRTEAALRGAHQRSVAAVEAEPDGPAITERWYDYSRARDRMLEATDTDVAPWYILRSDDKRTARLNAIAPHPLADSLQEASPGKSQAAGPIEEARLRRSGVAARAAIRGRAVSQPKKTKRSVLSGASRRCLS